jgi:hypothetical protein
VAQENPLEGFGAQTLPPSDEPMILAALKTFLTCGLQQQGQVISSLSLLKISFSKACEQSLHWYS